MVTGGIKSTKIFAKISENRVVSSFRDQAARTVVGTIKQKVVTLFVTCLALLSNSVYHPSLHLIDFDAFLVFRLVK